MSTTTSVPRVFTFKAFITPTQHTLVLLANFVLHGAKTMHNWLTHPTYLSSPINKNTRDELSLNMDIHDWQDVL